MKEPIPFVAQPKHPYGLRLFFADRAEDHHFANLHTALDAQLCLYTEPKCLSYEVYNQGQLVIARKNQRVA